MGLYSEIDRASYADLNAWWTVSLPIWADDRALVLDEIAHALCQCGARSLQLLQADTHSSDSDKRAAALSALTHNNLATATTLTDLRDAFYSPEPRLKTVALWGFIHLATYPLPRTELETLMRQPDERLSALAMTYLSYAYPEEAIGILHNALQSQNARQREYACDVIGDEGITELRSAVASLLHDPDEYVRQAAHSNLEMLDHE